MRNFVRCAGESFDNQIGSQGLIHLLLAPQRPFKCLKWRHTSSIPPAFSCSRIADDAAVAVMRPCMYLESEPPLQSKCLTDAYVDAMTMCLMASAVDPTRVFRTRRCTPELQARSGTREAIGSWPIAWMRNV